MMEITAPGLAGVAPVTRGQTRRGGAVFHLPEEGQPAASGTVGQGGAIPLPAEVGLMAMLSLQEEEGAAARNRRARRHGEALLAELTNLQRALLLGGATEAALLHLAALASDVPAAADPGLDEILGEIVTRAKVAVAGGAASKQFFF